jgi:hypothetical protein
MTNRTRILLERKIRQIVQDILSEAKKINLEQPVSNLYIKGWGLDINGNNRITVGFPNDRGFPIQTGGGSLPNTHKIITGKKTSDTLSASELRTIGKEITDYVSKYGSKDQRSRLKVYKNESRF